MLCTKYVEISHSSYNWVLSELSLTGKPSTHPRATMSQLLIKSIWGTEGYHVTPHQEDTAQKGLTGHSPKWGEHTLQPFYKDRHDRRG